MPTEIGIRNLKNTTCCLSWTSDIYIYSLRGVFGCKCSFWTLNSSPLWCFSWLLSVVTITLRHCNLNWPLAQMVSNYLSLFTTWLWMLKEKTNHKFELNFTWNHFEQNHRYWNVLCCSFLASCYKQAILMLQIRLFYL